MHLIGIDFFCGFHLHFSKDQWDCKLFHGPVYHFFTFFVNISAQFLYLLLSDVLEKYLDIEEINNFT